MSLGSDVRMVSTLNRDKYSNFNLDTDFRLEAKKDEGERINSNIKYTP